MIAQDVDLKKNKLYPMERFKAHFLTFSKNLLSISKLSYLLIIHCLIYHVSLYSIKSL